MTEPKETKKNSKAVANKGKKNQTKKAATKTQKQKQAEENKKSTGVLFMLIGLILALWFGVVFVGTFTPQDGLGQIILKLITGIFNILIALCIVYGGLLTFSQKKGKVSSWQMLGWLFFLFAVLGIIHVATFGLNLKESLLPSLKGLGGGFCGLLPAGLVIALPSLKAQYVVLSAFGILGILLGTDLKIFSYISSLFSKDPEKIKQRQEQRALKAEKKRLKQEAALLRQEQELAQQQALNPQIDDLVTDFPATPDYSDLAKDVLGEKANKNFSKPPIITDYSGKAFEEITDLSKITVGDLLEQDSSYGEPGFLKNVMPRISQQQTVNRVTAQELEEFADAVVAQTVTYPASQPQELADEDLPSGIIIKDFSIKDLPSSADLTLNDAEANLESLETAAAYENEDLVATTAIEDWEDFAAGTNQESTIFLEQPELPPVDSPAPLEDTLAEQKATEDILTQAEAEQATAAGAPKQVMAKKSTLPVEPPKEKKPYVLPPISLLKGGINVKNPRLNKQIMDNSIALEEALASFGVKTKVVEVVCGPSVIRYELQPGPGVKVSKIVNLADDIALALAARGLRIEAPVPGKSVVGIEIAKAEVNPVFFKDVLATEKFAKSKSKISIAFGIDINGNPIVGDLADMPHLLIAGATGSGKSVCMNTLICSILFKATPEEVKIIMIDPKKVELASYNGLPHLGRPVVTDSKKAAGILREIVNEMERRYTVFASAGVKNFTGFNQLKDAEKMPQIVVLIDELADLMMVASKDVEDAICRLAQMARAAGIHLVIATQRPSVDVITGLIKANVPSRIAFAVSSQIDSRTILDMGGAEKLLGKGDMLYFPIGKQKPIRVQGAFLSEEEIQALVGYCCNQGAQEFIELPTDNGSGSNKDNGAAEDEDELFLEACKQVIVSGQASASSLQRKFRIGYNRAARLIETMEELHVISSPEGNKRTVLMGQDMFNDLFANQED